MIEKDKRFIYTIAFFYSIVIIFIISFPAYFYINIEKKSYLQNHSKELEQYTLRVEKSIYDFSDSKSNIFNFPRSFFYDAYLYDTNRLLIFATNNEKISFNNFTNIDNILYKKIRLNTNRLNAKYLILKKPFSYGEIYTKALILALLLGVVIFFIAIFFIKISIYPLEKANRYLNAFFNDAMHEFKTPLGVIQLNLDMLRDKEDSKGLQRVYNSVQAITLIYEDIEYLIKHKHVDYRHEEIDCSLFLQSRVEFFTDLAKVKNIIIESNIASDIHLFINRIELQRIIDNTLSNAIKYSNKNRSIFVLLKKENEIIFLSVKDEGFGIKDTKHIFTRYYRENSIKGGFGIGLNIVKNICDSNNIVISVQTEIGRGSIFTYSFPIKKVNLYNGNKIVTKKLRK